MPSLRNLTTGQRLGGGFAVLIVLMIVLVAVGVDRLNAVRHNTEIIVDDRFVKIALAHTIENEVNRQSRAIRTALIASDPAVVQSELEKVESSTSVVTKAIADLQEIVHTDAGKDALKALVDARNAFHERESQLVGMIKAGHIDEGRQFLVSEMLAPQTEYLASIALFASIQTDQMHEFAGETATVSHNANVVMMALCALAALLAAVIGTLITRSLTRAMGGEPAYVAGIAGEIASGNLAVDVHVRDDDQGSVVAAMRNMRDSLARMVDQVRISADSIATGSAQIAAGNSDLSSRTEEQASSLEQTSASMEELTSAVKQSADNAREANQLAGEASVSAANGGKIVGQVIATMNEIASSSKKMAEIINVIDGIAFQTNILALNAAVEAARAGEQGRGFAVVASEVRSLAQRSAQAAREIKQMINESVGRVDSGNLLVGGAGASMEEIVLQVKRVSDLIGEITQVSAEQSSGIGQVNEAITQMDQVTQQNAALVEQSAAAAASLSHQASTLAEAVAFFKTAVARPRAAAPVARAAAKPIVKPAPAAKPTALPHRSSSRPALAPVAASTPAPAKESTSDEWAEF